MCIGYVGNYQAHITKKNRGTCFLILPKSALLKNPNFDLEVLITSNPSVGLLCVGIRYKIMIWVVQMVEWPSYELICTI